jgi:hypothetical protein
MKVCGITPTCVSCLFTVMKVPKKVAIMNVLTGMLTIGDARLINQLGNSGVSLRNKR